MTNYNHGIYCGIPDEPCSCDKRFPAIIQGRIDMGRSFTPEQVGRLEEFIRIVIADATK